MAKRADQQGMIFAKLRSLSVTNRQPNILRTTAQIPELDLRLCLISGRRTDMPTCGSTVGAQLELLPHNCTALSLVSSPAPGGSWWSSPPLRRPAKRMPPCLAIPCPTAAISTPPGHALTALSNCWPCCTFGISAAERQVELSKPFWR